MRSAQECQDKLRDSVPLTAALNIQIWDRSCRHFPSSLPVSPSPCVTSPAEFYPDSPRARAGRKQLPASRPETFSLCYPDPDTTLLSPLHSWLLSSSMRTLSSHDAVMNLTDPSEIKLTIALSSRKVENVVSVCSSLHLKWISNKKTIRLHIERLEFGYFKHFFLTVWLSLFW